MSILLLLLLLLYDLYSANFEDRVRYIGKVWLIGQFSDLSGI